MSFLNERQISEDKNKPIQERNSMNLIEKINNDLTINPGRFLTGASYRGIGVPDCVRQGTQSAQEIVDYLRFKLCKE